MRFTRWKGHVRYINIQAWLRGFRVKIANFSSFFCLSIPKGDLDTKKATPNIEIWPESLGAMSEYWYIERRLLHWHRLVQLFVVWKICSCLLIPNCARNDFISFTYCILTLLQLCVKAFPVAFRAKGIEASSGTNEQRSIASRVRL